MLVVRFFTLSLMLFASLAFAGPGYTTYQAKIIKPDGLPLESNPVNFKFTILSPANCVLYAETFSNISMASTGGLISFSLGSGVKNYPASATTFEQVFSNITPNLSCDAGDPDYTPAANDSRKIVMQFFDNGGWQTLPAMNINAVPYAMYASDAQKLGGVSATSFVQKADFISCVGGEAVFYNGTSFSCVSVGGGGAVTSGSVITALGYAPVAPASLTALTSSVTTISSYAADVSSTVFSVSATVSSLTNSVSTLSNSVAASFSALASSQWVSLNGLTSGTQTFATGTAGNAPNVSSTATVHTFNFPFASVGTTTAGVISNTDYSLFSTVVSKITSSAASIAQVLGYTPATVDSVTTLSSTVASVSATLTTLTNNTAVSFAAITNSQWVSSGTQISYSAGNVEVSGSLNVAADASLNGITAGLGGGQQSANTVYGNQALLNNTTGLYHVAVGASALVSNTTSIFNTAVGYWALRSNTIGNYNTGIGQRVLSSNTTGTGNTALGGALGVNTTGNYNTCVGDRCMTANNSGSFNSAMGYQALRFNVSGTENSAYGMNALANSQGDRNVGIGSSAGINLTSGTNNIAIGYNTNFASATASNQINIGNVIYGASGNIGIGTNAPTALMSLAAGTSSTPSLKLTAGVLNTTGQAGSIEYDGTNFYLTDATNTRRAIAATAAAGTYDNADTISNSSGNIALYPNSGVGSVIVSATTNSTNSTTGALVVKGGMGISGNIFSSGTIITTSNIQAASITATSGISTSLIQGNTDLLLNPSVGNVGIGTSTPTIAKLSVVQTNGAAIAATSGNSADHVNIGIGRTAIEGRLGIASGGGSYATGAAAGDLILRVDDSTKKLHLSVGTTETMTLVSGSVGIGTSTPSADVPWPSPALDISGTRGTMILRTTNIGGISTLRFVGPTLGSDYHVNMIDSSGSLTFGAQSGSVATMALTKLGNVGIGTTNPGSMLEVSSASSNTNVLTPATTTLRLTNTDATSGNTVDIRFTGTGGYPGAKISSIFSNQASSPAGALAFMTTNNSVAGFGERMRIDPNGHVGIGTTAPTEKLEVSGGVKINGVGQIGPAGIYGYGLFTGGTNTFIGQMYGAASGIQFTNSIGTNTLSILENGDVGIGTAGAISRLTVAANAANANLVTLYNSAPDGVSGFNTYSSSGTLVGGFGWGNYNSAGSYNEKMFINSSKSMTFITNNSERMGITSSGLVGIGIAPTSILSIMHTTPTLQLFDQDFNVADGTSLGKIAFGSAGGEWASIGAERQPGFADDVNSLVFKTSFAVGAGGPGVNNERMRLNPQGYLGINTNAPTFTLDVSGVMRVTGQAFTNTGNGAFTVLSDIRFKNINGSYDRGLAEILDIDVIKYNYKKNNPLGADSTREYVGVSAQNLQQEIPEAVEPRLENGQEYLTINTSPVLWTVINAVKELYAKLLGHDAEFTKQTRRIASLEEQNALKDKEIKELKAYLCTKDPSAPICK